jgi:uncharacterized damage-inducible protein DinB
MDDALIAYIEGISGPELNDAFQYTDTKGNQLTWERGLAVHHVLNHGTHHRGQITAVLHRLTSEDPELDMLYFLNPGA